MHVSDQERDFVDFVGDAHMLFTAPYFPDTDPLDFRPRSRMPENGVLDAQGRLVTTNQSVDRFVRGSLTFGAPSAEVLTQFAASDDFTANVRALVEHVVGLPVTVALTGLLFPDGYGSVALRITVAEGWHGERRDAVLDAFGPRGRDRLADQLRTRLLPALSDVGDSCCPEFRAETVLPYFNLTYVASTTHHRAGRTYLPDELRQLIYPRSPELITSDSPWSDEFFFAGYAFSLLASREPRKTLEQLEYLLLHLDVLYARMDRSATAADRLVRSLTRGEDVNWLVTVERQLRADYQALVGPTFSFDYHMLKLRDALLYAWETDKIHQRTDILLQMAREAVERELAREQARRVSRLNAVVAIVALLSFVSSVESAVNLFAKVF